MYEMEGKYSSDGTKIVQKMSFGEFCYLFGDFYMLSFSLIL